MAEYSKFFDSGDGDNRVYSAGDFAQYYAMFQSKGVIPINFSNPYPTYDNNSLMVTKKNNNTVTVSPGVAVIHGYQYINSENLDLTVTSENTLIILRLDTAAKKITAMPSNVCYTNRDIFLAKYTITNGNLSVTDFRTFAEAWCSKPSLSQIDDEITTINSMLTAHKSDIDKKLYTSNLRSEILKIDGAGTGIDADQLDGHHGADYVLHSNIHASTKEPTLSDGVNGDIWILYEE